MKTVNIKGMQCNHCKTRVEKALNAIEGVSAVVKLDENLANVNCDNDISDDIIIRAINDAGFEVESVVK